LLATARLAAVTDKPDLHPESITAQGLGHVDPSTAALVPPLHMSTTFERFPDHTYLNGRGYTRADSPAYDDPEKLLAKLDEGAEAMLFSSGMAAITSVFSVLLPGDHVIVPRVVYWGVRKWLAEFTGSWGLDVSYVDTSSTDAVAAALRVGRTRIVWLETPANPTWEIADIEAISALAHAAGARVVVDSTSAPPVIQRPLTLGADIVMHSATKYLNGHSDVLAGALVVKEDDAFTQRIRAWRRGSGNVLGPFEAWLLLRGMRTLFVRVRQQCETAMKVAHHFEGHAALDGVQYPGLASHAGHDIAARQMPGGFGGMMSLLVRGNDADAVAVAGRVQLIKRATSLGGTETLIEQRRSVEGPSSPVPGNLLRISIGLEHVGDLIADLEQALAPLIGRSRTIAPGAPATAIERVFVDSIRTTVIARGGTLDLLSGGAADVRLAWAGSVGAVLPVRESIDRAFLAAGATSVAFEPSLDQFDLSVINAALAAHGGSVTAEGLDANGALQLRFAGRCVGCTLAEVTLRQGIEPLLGSAVVDVTDHRSGTNPFYAPTKR
jgi:cystathionine gamma-synthase